MRTRQFYASVLSAFAILATVLAAVGVSGVMTVSVSQRTREIGIRMAVGARAMNIVATVGGRALPWVLGGVTRCSRLAVPDPLDEKPNCGESSDGSRNVYYRHSADGRGLSRGCSSINANAVNPTVALPTE